MKFYRFCLLVLSCVSGFAQDPQQPVSLADVTARTYPIDTTAAAIILSDYCDMHLEYHSQMGLIYHRKTRIKILKKAGYDWATVAIPYYSNGYHGRESVRKISGQTFNVDGAGGVQVTPLAEEAIFEEKSNAKQYVKRFTLPNVREGSVIEYSYTFTSEFAYLENWVFQRDIPVIRSECRLVLGSNYQFQILLRGQLPLAVEETSRTPDLGVRYRWVMNNIPVFKEEPFMASILDYVAMIHFQGIGRDQGYGKTWEELDNVLMEHRSFGKAFARTEFLNRTGKLLQKQYPDTLARITAVHDLIKQRMQWDGGHSIWSNDPETDYNLKRGDCSDINFLLIGLLRAAGLQAYPLVLRTRDQGQLLEEHPSVAWFNHVAVLTTLQGRDFFLDATLRHLPAGELPPNCLNGKGRLVDSQHARWVSLTPRHRQGVTYTLQLALQPDGTLAGQAEMVYAGHNALRWRVGLAGQDTTSFLQNRLNQAFTNFMVSHPALENLDSLTKPLLIKCTLQSSELVQQAGERLYLTPLLSTARHENPFKAPTRTFPVDFGSPLEETSLVVYTLPAGYGVEELPKAAALTLPNNDGRFTYAISLNENQLQVTSRLILRKTVFTSNEYPTLRTFFDKIVAKHAEQVVLKKY